MDELIVNNSTLIVVGAMALFYFHVQSDGVTPLVAFALITVILPFVIQQILVALGSPRTPFERDDYRTSWLGRRCSSKCSRSARQENPAASPRVVRGRVIGRGEAL